MSTKTLKTPTVIPSKTADQIRLVSFAIDIAHKRAQANLQIGLIVDGEFRFIKEIPLLIEDKPEDQEASPPTPAVTDFTTAFAKKGKGNEDALETMLQIFWDFAATKNLI